MSTTLMPLALTLAALVWMLPPGRSSDPPGAFVSADECARCHRDIHQYWKVSIHAQAADNYRFRDALERVMAREQRGDDRLCLRCHAPAAYYGNDFSFERKASWEGVTCDFCHSVARIRPNPDQPFVLEPGRVKTGPFRESAPVGHAARYSSVHTTSDLCAPCHQFVNRLGTPVLTTHEEWLASPQAARGTTCQACHMRAVAGKVVDPKVTRTPNRPVNLHAMAGGHSVTELNRAMVALISAARRGKEVDVVVEVTNRGAGHALPTGSPLRAIELVVDVDAGFPAKQRAARRYGRAVVDANGRALDDEGAVWLHGARTTEDTRLGPGERRVERFTFPASPASPFRASARFFYRYTLARETTPPFLVVTTWLDADRKQSGMISLR